MNLPQHGGEGKEKYKGNKSDMSLKQHGGEGKGLGTKGGSTAYTPSKSPNTGYTGPGRNLKTQ